MPSNEMVVREEAAEIVELSFNPTGEEAELIESVRAFADRAKTLVVSDAASYDGANQALREVATLTKGVDTRRKGRTAPIDELKRGVMNYFRQGEDALKAARAALWQQISAWEEEQKAIQREQQRKANEAADKERKRKEQLAQKAVERGDVERAVQHAEAAASVTAPIIAAPVTKSEGVGRRTYWHFKVVDQMQLPHMYLMPNEALIQNLVDSAHEGAPELLKGAIEVWSETQPLVRGTR